MKTYEEVFESYGMTHDIKKMAGTALRYLEFLKPNQTVISGDGETYFWLLTERAEVNLNPVNKG